MIKYLLAMKTLILIIAGMFLQQYAAAQNAPALNVPSKSNSRSRLAEGPNVWGVFEGRVHCQSMAEVMHIQMAPNCEKLKWRFSFFVDPKTKQPATYKWEGSLYREKVREGKWTILKGTADDPDATVIQLDPDHPERSIFLLKGDENVLFVLDGSKKLMVGGDYLSYTFNRTVN